MAKLTEEQKQFIVMELAMWSTPSEVVAAVKEQFGIPILPQQVNEYNPNTIHKKAIAQKWQILFEATRKKFLDDTSSIAIANKAYRLRRLDAMMRNTKSPALAAQLLEQASKEVGGAYTNRREVTGRDGGPLEVDDVSGLTPEERKARIAQLLGVGNA